MMLCMSAFRCGEYKCGPDYIDPMLHRAASGGSAYNLDPFFMEPEALRRHFAVHAGEVSIIEGAMGFRDGIAGTSRASASEVAELLDVPVVFVERKRDRYGVGDFGYLPHRDEWAIPSRHLGLLRPEEISDFQKLLHQMGRQAEETIDIDGILKLAASREMRLAVARDEAFCFMYEENLEILRMLDCEPVFFSPLHDSELPSDIRGLYLPGGYPELYEANDRLRESIRRAIDGGLPTIAEGGGFMYLYPGETFETPKLQRFGYMTMRAGHDNILCRAGDEIRAREFHYWDSSRPGDSFTAKKAGRELSWSCAHATDSLYAGFPQLYLPAKPETAERFAGKMRAYESHKGGN